MAGAKMDVDSGGGVISAAASPEKRRRLETEVVVWAKVKNYPWWPAVIRSQQRVADSLTPEDFRLLPDCASEDVRCVEFFNDRNRFAVVHVRDLVEYSADMKLLSCAGKYRKEISEACDQADVFIKAIGPTYQQEACSNDGVPFLSPPRHNIEPSTRIVDDDENHTTNININTPLPPAKAAVPPAPANDDFDSSDDDLLDVPFATIVQSRRKSALSPPDPPETIIAPPIAPVSPPTPAPNNGPDIDNDNGTDALVSPPAPIPMDDDSDTPPTPEGHPPWTTPLTAVQNVTPPRRSPPATADPPAANTPTKSDVPMKLRLREEYASKSALPDNNNNTSTAAPRKRRRSTSPELGVGNTVGDAREKDDVATDEGRETTKGAADYNAKRRDEEEEDEENNDNNNPVFERVASVQKAMEEVVQLAKEGERMKKTNKALKEEEERVRKKVVEAQKSLESVQALLKLNNDILADTKTQVQQEEQKYRQLRQQVNEEKEKLGKYQLRGDDGRKHNNNINNNSGAETGGSDDNNNTEARYWNNNANKKKRIMDSYARGANNSSSNNNNTLTNNNNNNEKKLAKKTRIGVREATRAPVLPPLIPRRGGGINPNNNNNDDNIAPKDGNNGTGNGDRTAVKAK